MSMPKNAVRNSLAALAVVTLPLLAGCGGSSDKAGSNSGSTGDHATTNADGAAQLTIPDGTDAETKKTYIMENAIAVCMKKQGFTYTPHAKTQTAGQDLSWLDGEDYALSKKMRQKYGFGTYAAAVYPDDPNTPAIGEKGKMRGIVQDDDEAGLTPAQRTAYETALDGPPAKSKAEEKVGGCTEKGRAAAYGPALSAEAEKKAEAARVEENRSNGLALNGDAQLVQLAQRYATCLKAQGIPVSTTQPTGMATMVRLDLTAKLTEKHSWTKEEALPLLAKDIGIALKDLECGKDFRAAYFPKEKAHPYWGDGA